MPRTATKTRAPDVEEEIPPQEPVIIDSGDPDRKWYVIHTYSGYENKVGQRRTVQRKVFPGYVLVDMRLDDQSWYVVRNTPGVTGFVGSGNKPIPLEESEVRKILKQMT